MANQRATAQDMRTMLEDEFFRDHIQFGGAEQVQVPGTGQATPATAPGEPSND